MTQIAISAKGVSKNYILSHSRQADSFKELIKHNTLKFFSPRKFKGEEELFWALKDVSFDVIKGECLGILGKNGSGKSTLLKILARVVSPSAGFVGIKGKCASLLEVGTGFHPELTGRENIYLNGAILGMTKAEIEDKFDDIVSFSEVETFLDTPVKYYSSGMYVRLAYAIASTIKPDILIVDEVLAVGDEEFQDKCLANMMALKESGTILLFVTHSYDLFEKLCSKVLWLEKGKVHLISEDVSNVVDQFREQSHHHA